MSDGLNEAGDIVDTDRDINDVLDKPLGEIPSIIEGYLIDPAKLLEANEKGGFKAMTQELSHQMYDNLNVTEVGKHAMELLVARQLVNVAKKSLRNLILTYKLIAC